MTAAPIVGRIDQAAPATETMAALTTTHVRHRTATAYRHST